MTLKLAAVVVAFWAKLINFKELDIFSKNKDLLTQIVINLTTYFLCKYYFNFSFSCKEHGKIFFSSPCFLLAFFDMEETRDFFFFKIFPRIFFQHTIEIFTIQI